MGDFRTYGVAGVELPARRADRWSVNSTKTSLSADSASINGDDRLTREQRTAYMRYHRARNHDNALRSRAEGVATEPGPGDVDLRAEWSPARHDVAAFFRWFGRAAFERFGGREVTILDIGCGGAFIAPFLAEAGLRGVYCGVDLRARGDWAGHPIHGLQTRFVQGDIMSMDVDALPMADLVVSATALEHIADDRGAVGRVARRLVPGGMQGHFVPGEEALDLYGPHGWRQYSPRCLRSLFPGGRIFRYGGTATSRLHLFGLTRALERGTPDVRARHPGLYVRALKAARRADAAEDNQFPSMYGVVG